MTSPVTQTETDRADLGSFGLPARIMLCLSNAWQSLFHALCLSGEVIFVVGSFYQMLETVARVAVLTNTFGAEVSRRSDGDEEKKGQKGRQRS